MAGNAGEKHGNLKARMTIALAGNDDSAALNAFTVYRKLQSNDHFRPGLNGHVASKFDAVFSEPDGMRRETKVGRLRLNCNWLEQTAINSARAHITPLSYHRKVERQIKSPKLARRNRVLITRTNLVPIMLTTLLRN